MTPLSRALKLHATDDVAIARDAITSGTPLDEFDGLVARGDIPAAHKIALRPIAQGEALRRYCRSSASPRRPSRRAIASIRTTCRSARSIATTPSAAT